MFSKPDKTLREGQESSILYAVQDTPSQLEQSPEVYGARGVREKKEERVGSCMLFKGLWVSVLSYFDHRQIKITFKLKET